MQVKCNKCGHVADGSEFPKGYDFFGNSYIARCPKCDNWQSPGDASYRMMGGRRPFEFVRERGPESSEDAMGHVLHNSREAS
jgi:NAD-dependent SIR2 family protein deacetylase